MRRFMGPYRAVQFGGNPLLWPVYISFKPKKWKDRMKVEYSRQAAKPDCSDALLFNPIGDCGDLFGGCFRFVDRKLNTPWKYSGRAFCLLMFNSLLKY